VDGRPPISLDEKRQTGGPLGFSAARPRQLRCWGVPVSQGGPTIPGDGGMLVASICNRSGRSATPTFFRFTKKPIHDDYENREQRHMAGARRRFVGRLVGEGSGRVCSASSARDQQFFRWSGLRMADENPLEIRGLASSAGACVFVGRGFIDASVEAEERVSGPLRCLPSWRIRGRKRFALLVAGWVTRSPQNRGRRPRSPIRLKRIESGPASARCSWRAGHRGP